MIFPLLRGLLPPTLVPSTWFLLVTNVVVFLVNLPQFIPAQDELNRFFDDPNFMKTQGAVFSQFISDQPRPHSRFLREMAHRALAGDEMSQMLMGGYAMRNQEFMETAADRTVRGDTIAIAGWRSSLADLRAIQARHPTYKWGLSSAHRGFVNWITYQFAHSGAQHLLWNMIFLALFASCLETAVGGSIVILVYLGAGLFGAFVFALLSGFSYSPLIGASGAVSGLMACLAVLLWQERVRFFYWLLPVPGYFGIRDLPAWLIVIAFLIPDLAGHLATVGDASGMAYSAHLGGALLGALTGFAIRQGWLEKEDVESHERIW